MDILIGLIIISLGIALIFLGIFLWSLRAGQYDDTTTPAIRILFDNPGPTFTTPEVPAENETDKDHISW